MSRAGAYASSKTAWLVLEIGWGGRVRQTHGNELGKTGAAAKEMKEKGAGGPTMHLILDITSTINGFYGQEIEPTPSNPPIAKVNLYPPLLIYD